MDNADFLHGIADLFTSLWIAKFCQELFKQQTFWLFVFAAVLIGTVVYWRHKRLQNKDGAKAIQDTEIRAISKEIVEGAPKYRFRKRDKAEFMGRQLIRKVKNFGGDSNNFSRRFKPQEKVLKFAARWLFNTKERQSRPVKRPPSTFFEPDVVSDDAGSFPREIVYMLKNIRVFGHFETPFFLELCRHVTVVSLSAGQYLFHPGEPDDSIYVVQEGQLSVFIKDHDQEFEVKKAEPGDSVMSLLSILDALSGHAAPFKTVSARANVNSKILKLSGTAFNEIFERYPESWVRAVQIIALRLQRVTFTTLHYYLGLSTELTKPTLREQAGSKKTRQVNQMPTISAELMNATQRVRTNSFGRSYSLDIVAAANTRATSCGEAPSDPTPNPSSETEACSYNEEHRTREALFNVGSSGTLQQQLAEKENLKKIAKEQLVVLLGLQNDPKLLDGKFQVQALPPGCTLTEQGSENVPLVYVISGTLELTQRSFEDEKKQVTSAIVHSHEMVGGLAMLTGEPSFYTVKTRQQCRVAIISKCDFYEIMRRSPKVVLNIAHTVIVRLSPFIRSIDFALDWEMCDAGKALYSQGDAADSLYVVLCGRLRSVVKKTDNEKELVGEYGRGDMVGLVEVVTSTPRATTVISIRYTELSKLPVGLLNFIKLRFPQVLTRIIQLLGQCIIDQQQPKSPTATFLGGRVEAARHVANLNTIAIVAVSEDVPLTAFSLELANAMNMIKPTLRLSKETIERDLGPSALRDVNECRLFSWLSQQEDAYPVVLYQCDFELSSWARRCIRQADCILIVANGDSKPTVGPLEELFERLGVRAQKELILLWREGTEQPTNTQEWLDVSVWVSSYFHVRAPHRIYSRRNSLKLIETYDRLFKGKVDRFSDFSRLARTLTGHAVGIVLGGGGARGAAHVGILKSLREHGIPIDMVGGTSIGSLVGGIYCSNPDIHRVIQKAREWFMYMSSVWNILLELTYPYSAMFTGSGFNYSLKKIFGDRQIEDLWIPYFSVTTDITSSEMRIHRSADVMRSMGVGEILAVDVGAQDEKNVTNYGDSLNGFWVLYKRWFPWNKPVRVLNMAEIQSRLAYVSCVRQLEQVKKAPYCKYLRPPIDQYQTLDFALFDEILNVGYQYGKTTMDSWQVDGTLNEILRGEASKHHDELVRLRTITNMKYVPQSFTDLAAFVSKWDHSQLDFSFDFSDEDSMCESDFGTDETVLTVPQSVRNEINPVNEQPLLDVLAERNEHVMKPLTKLNVVPDGIQQEIGEIALSKRNKHRKVTFDQEKPEIY